MDRYDVTGMSCAACSARVEKAVSRVEGVERVEVNLLTGSMTVEGKAPPGEVIAAVTRAGYGAELRRSAGRSTGDGTVRKLWRRLIVSLALLLPLMYLSMGPMLGLPLPRFLAESFLLRGLAEMALSLAVLLVNRSFFTGGAKALFSLAPNMDTLIALGSGVSFLYSAAVLFFPGAELGSDLWFESAAMILTLITVGKLLEALAKGRTADALKSLEKLAPTEARVLRDGVETTVPIAELRVGDLFTVRPGETVPADGVIIRGSTSVNEAALTGESLPVDKAEGDTLTGATVNLTGHAVARATRVGEDTAFSGIVRMVAEASASKAPIAKTADKAAGIFVPVVLGIALVTLTVWLLLGETLSFSVARAVSVLVISCPCSLGLATPVAVMVGSGVGAKNGILFKNAAALENAGRTKLVALDKTGTLTVGRPRVERVLPAAGISEDELLQYAYSLEKLSEHPLALAVCRAAEEKELSPLGLDAFRAVPGQGLTADLAEGPYAGQTLSGGNAGFVPCADTMRTEEENASAAGLTPLFFSRGGRLLGLLLAADELKEDSAEAVRELGELGLSCVMITGDSKTVARAVSARAGLGRYFAGVLPEGKEQAVADLCAEGFTAMVGDGINDAPALTRADLGIAVGAGTDVAIDAADVVLMKNSLRDVAACVRLSRAAMLIIRENLFWAFFYNALCIPLAAGAFTGLLGWTLNPMWAAAAMSLSSFTVVMNALRLNLVKLYPNGKSQNGTEVSEIEQIETKINPKEEQNMEKLLHIEGMMCHHCEAHVKKALEALPGVAEAAADFEKGTALVRLTSAVPNDMLSAVVEEEGYQVISIE